MMRDKRTSIVAIGMCVFGLLCLPGIKCSDAKGHSLEPIAQLVEIDPDQPAKDITYTVRGGDVASDSSCHCELDVDSIVEAFTITNAYLSDASGVKHNVSHEVHLADNCITLQVEVPIPGNSLPGEYKYSIGYDYACNGHLVSKHCTGKSKQMELTVIVVDYKLRLLGSDSGISIQETNKESEPSKVVIASEKIGSNVSLKCSSSLSAKDSSHSIPVKFTFLKDGQRSDGNYYTKTMECKDTGEVADDYVTQTSNWIISRTKVSPGDCVLTITNIGPNDVGKYGCAGLLSIDGSIYGKDWSQMSIDLEVTKSQSISKLYSLFALSLVGLGAVALIALFAYRYWYLRPRQPQIRRLEEPSEDSEGSSILSHHSLHQSYGSILPDSTESMSRETSLIEQENVSAQLQPSPDSSHNSDGGSGSASLDSLKSSSPDEEKRAPSPTTTAIREGVDYYNKHMEQPSSDSDTKMSQDSDDPAAGSSPSSQGLTDEQVHDTD